MCCACTWFGAKTNVKFDLIRCKNYAYISIYFFNFGYIYSQTSIQTDIKSSLLIKVIA